MRYNFPDIVPSTEAYFATYLARNPKLSTEPTPPNNDTFQQLNFVDSQITVHQESQLSEDEFGTLNIMKCGPQCVFQVNKSSLYALFGIPPFYLIALTLLIYTHTSIAR